jgi:hypothetical protein
MAYSQTFNPYAGVAESAVTSNSIPLMDAAYGTVSWSLTTSSATASVWTMQGSNEDGFTATLPAYAWATIAANSAQGFYSLTTLPPRWARWQRTPSNSSSTLLLAYRVG